jgi:choice-of-anchor B domain-containing protein
MKRIYLLAAMATTFGTVFQLNAQRCADGFAGAYPCDMVDQISEMPLSLFEAQNANDIWGWTNPETGREFVAFGLFNKTAFIDITTPEYPLYLGYLPTHTNGSLWRDVKVIDGWAFIVAEATGHGMQIFDMRRLEALSASEVPVVFDSDAHYPNWGNAHNIAVDEESGYAYGVGTNTFAGGLHVVDVNDPLNPVYAGSSEEDGYTHDAQIVVYNGPDQTYQGRQLCFASNEDAMTIFDVTDKTDIVLISTTDYENVGYAHQNWLTEDHRYLLSNDETDELTFGNTTRTIVWDLADLENPLVIGYADLGTTSIDHNLYIQDNLVYQSNYTSGLRILGLDRIAEGELEPFGFFDVSPNTDILQFSGTWSNYPYFESGIVPTTNMYAGIHFLKPRLNELSTTIVKVCGSGFAGLGITINRPLPNTLNYVVEMSGAQSISNQLLFPQTDGAPAQNSVIFQGLNGVDPGYYPGYVQVTDDVRDIRMPFVLVKDVPGGEAPVLTSPVDDVVLPSQLVDFSFTDDFPGYAHLQVALDASFEEIVFETTHYSTATIIQAVMPYMQTAYFWRLIKPTGCGDDLVSETGSFSIDFVNSTGPIEKEASFTLYPNPATDQLFVAFTERELEFIDVFDITGRKVAQWNVKNVAGALSVDVSGFAPGVYIATSGGKGQKFIKR